MNMLLNAPWDDDSMPSMDDDVNDIEVINDALPNIKSIVLLDIEQGYTALEIISDLTWLWSRISDSSVERWCRAINNEVKRHAQKSRPELLKAA